MTKHMKSVMTILLVLVCTAASALAQIQPNQSVRIMISGVPQDEKSKIDGDYPVAGNGTINMPYIHAVSAAGMMPEVLQATLQARFISAGIYRNPTFQVISTKTNGGVVEQIVNVGGQVRRPGPVPLTHGLTLWNAIQAAGGPTEFGSMKRVRLMRAGKVKEYNVKDPQFMQIPLVQDDAIDVPEKTILNDW